MKQKIKELWAILTQKKSYINLGTTGQVNKKGVGVYF